MSLGYKYYNVSVSWFFVFATYFLVLLFIYKLLFVSELLLLNSNFSQE